MWQLSLPMKCGSSQSLDRDAHPQAISVSPLQEAARLDRAMISALGDFRHTMHIGKEDAFGTRSFLSKPRGSKAQRAGLGGLGSPDHLSVS
uniref:Uncharacterized protein n=1 Tax=Sphaerodactylus townsendi TaxID=933632 RepID=A0ACB8EWU1_9SAUR